MKKNSKMLKSFDQRAIPEKGTINILVGSTKEMIDEDISF